MSWFNDTTSPVLAILVLLVIILALALFFALFALYRVAIHRTVLPSGLPPPSPVHFPAQPPPAPSQPYPPRLL